MPFEPITHVKLNKKTGQPISNSTVKTYKTLLNRLAQQGYDTKEKLVSEQRPVVRYIESIAEEDTEDSRLLKRQYLSAIFYALEEYALESKQLYYDAFQVSKQNYGSEPKPKPRIIEASFDSSIFKEDLKGEFIRVDKEKGIINVLGLYVEKADRNRQFLSQSTFKKYNNKKTLPAKKNNWADPIRGEPGVKAYWITKEEAKELIEEKEKNEAK
jgi:hypothetical protein